MRVYKPIVICTLATLLLTEPVSVCAATVPTDACTIVTSSSEVLESDDSIVASQSVFQSSKSVKNVKSKVKFSNRKPRVTKIEKSGENSKSVYWTPIKGADGYQIKFSVDKKFRKDYSPTTISITGGEGNVIDCIALKKDKTYYFKVRGFKKNSKTGKRTYTKWSKVKVIKR